MPNQSKALPRKVFTSGLTPKRGRPRLWAYGYADLAALFGMNEAAIRWHVREGNFDPSSLESVLAFADRRRKR